jgi:uncharacterized delta-60 repeat protein
MGAARLGRARVPAMLVILVWLCFAFAAERAFAGAGGLDPGFAGDGSATLDSDGYAHANALALQPDGKIVVAALTGAAGHGTVYRLNPDGSPDASFSGDGKTTIGGLGSASAVALQPDGKIVVAGSTVFSGYGSTDAVVCRLNPDGSLDTSFDTDGQATIDSGGDEYANALALRADGKIVIAGFTSVGYDTTVYRLKPDGGTGAVNGALDTSFDTDGEALVDRGEAELAFALALQPDGKIVVAGYASAGASDTWDVAVYRLKPDGGTGAVNGALDTSFDTDGQATIDSGDNEVAYALALQPDGKIVVAGYTSPGAAVYRLNPNGGTLDTVNDALDTSFDTDGAVKLDGGGNASALTLQPDGKIVVAGFTSPGAAVYRLTPDGSLDTSFDTDGAVKLDNGGSANALALQPDRKIVVAGRVGGTYDATVYRLFGDPFMLTVTKSGSGSVTSTPAGITCGPTCSYGFDIGSELTLAGTAAPDWRFAGWSGAGCSGTGPCRLTLSGDTTVGAAFVPAAFGSHTLVKLRLAHRRIPARGPLPVRVVNRNDFTVRGKLSGKTRAKVAVSRHKRVKLRANAFSVGAHAKKTIKLRLPKALRRLLEHNHELKLRLTAEVKDPAGHTRKVKRRVTPKLKKKRRR